MFAKSVKKNLETENKHITSIFSANILCYLNHIRAYPTNINMLIEKHVAQSNDGTYLAIHRLDLGGNDVVHKLSSIRRSTLLGPSTRFRECSYSSLFLFFYACYNQNIVSQIGRICINQ